MACLDSYIFFKDGKVHKVTRSFILPEGIYYIYDYLYGQWHMCRNGQHPIYQGVVYDDLPANIKTIALLTI